jgi:hypothetical protein
MATPQSIELSTGAVEVFLPTGVDYMIGLYRDPAMSHWLTKNPPEREIVDESARYFSSVMPGLFNDLSISRGGIR